MRMNVLSERPHTRGGILCGCLVAETTAARDITTALDGAQKLPIFNVPECELPIWSHMKDILRLHHYLLPHNEAAPKVATQISRPFGLNAKARTSVA